MEKLEELEVFYFRELERIDKEFLNNLKLKKNTSSAEIEYKNKLKNLRRIYEKKYLEYLKTQRNYKKKESQIKKEKSTVIKIEKISLKSTFREQLLLKFSYLRFLCKLKIRSFFQKITPNFSKRLYYMILLKIKRFIDKLEQLKEKFITIIKNNLESIYSLIKNLIIKSNQFLIKLFSLINIFNKQKS